MKTSRLILSMILVAILSSGSTFAQEKVELGDNAALRYWSAFAQMQDVAISKQQVKELSAILDGTAPYDDSKYKDLVEKNKPALEIMARGTALPNCDWGLEYEAGPDIPMDYAPKAVALARLNVLYVFHLLSIGDKEGAVRALVAGLRFSRDVGNGGIMLPTVLAEVSLLTHLRAIAFVLDREGFTAQQRWMLAKSLAQLGPEPLDWQSAIKREMDLYNVLPWPPAAEPLGRIIQAYQSTLKDPSMLPKLQQMIASVPQPFQGLIIDPKRTLKNKQELSDKLLQVRTIVLQAR
jgi:hypothetical protein